MRLLLISDTHVPKRARDLPPPVWEEVDRADVVIHAGDWVDAALLDALQARAARLIACWGNNDGDDLRHRLPECAEATLHGLRFTVVHETGAAAGREARMAKRHPDTDVLVFGHSHIPWDTTAPTGLRLLNPGSPTDRRRQPHCTYLTAPADRGSGPTPDLCAESTRNAARTGTLAAWSPDRPPTASKPRTGTICARCRSTTPPTSTTPTGASSPRWNRGW